MPFVDCYRGAHGDVVGHGRRWAWALRAGAVLVPADPGLSSLFGKTCQIHNNGQHDRPRPPPRPGLSFRRLSRPHHHHCQDGTGSSRPQKDPLSAFPVDVMRLPKISRLQRCNAARPSTLRSCDRIPQHQNALRDTCFTAKTDIGTILS